MKYYAVASGINCGIFDSWEECKKNVAGVSGAKYKSFPTRKLAEEWMKVPVSAPKKSKYYAVKAGLVPGIYNTWEECQSQIKGFPGAKFKSFKNLKDAENYLVGTHTINPSAEELMVYLDGSHIKPTDKKGIGMYAEYDGKAYGTGIQFTKRTFFHFSESVFDEVSNPTMELAAAASFFSILSELRIPKELESICIHCDYNGVENFILKKWTPTKPYIKELVEMILPMMDKIRIPVKFVHVSGHSGNYGNDQADILAKGKRKTDMKDICFLFE